MLRAVVFDAGETLIDESRTWSLWADWLQVPPHVRFAVLGAVIERGEHHRRVFEILRPGFRFDEALEQRVQGGIPDEFVAADLYDDVVPCLNTLRERGIRIGVAGNQPAAFERVVLDAALPADLIASSERWGVEKPSARFFKKIAEELGESPGSIA